MLGGLPSTSAGTDAETMQPRGKKRYITGESKLFRRRPELQTMVDSAYIESISPGRRIFSQMFMGYPDMGSDVHGAIGLNIFLQITGNKQWWFIPPSQTPYIYTAINPNGFMAYTKTKMGKSKDRV